MKPLPGIIMITSILLLLIFASTMAADTSTIAEQQYTTMRNALCPAPGFEAQRSNEPLEVEPFQVFDDFYFVGHRTTSSWALTTDEGIILFDAMFHDNVEDTVVAGLKKLGFNPADIRFVIISHGHNDHFGGARHLQATYGARIVMSATDWVHMKEWPQRGTPAPFPDDDIAVKDGDTIALGGKVVRMVITPGHTPGTLSPVFPVIDNGESHLVGYWGGGAMSFLPPAELEQYILSAAAYRDMDEAVDVALTNHPFADGALLKRDALRDRHPGDPHPFVTGNNGFKQWMDVFIDCAQSVLKLKQKAK